MVNPGLAVLPKPWGHRAPERALTDPSRLEAFPGELDLFLLEGDSAPGLEPASVAESATQKAEKWTNCQLSSEHMGARLKCFRGSSIFGAGTEKLGQLRTLTREAIRIRSGTPHFEGFLGVAVLLFDHPKAHTSPKKGGTRVEASTLE